MRRLGRLALLLLLALAVASPALAGVATIETTAPLPDHSEQSIRMAFRTAVETAVRGAMAMGLPRVQLRQAVVLEDAVAVQILATDMEPDAETPEPDPDEAPGAGAGEPGRLDL